MKKVINKSAFLTLLLVFGFVQLAFAKDYSINTVAAGGYDVVSYHSDSKAVRGNGDHVASYKGETYLFSNDSNKKKFESNPAAYAPAFGGYCAYGVSVGKKFVGDPQLWKVVDKKLYLNLNPDIQSKWKKDVSGNITKAENQWQKIRDKAPADL